MNILFVTIFQNVATNGGTERITCSVASELKHTYGCKIYSIFDTGSEYNNNPAIFTQEVRLSQNDKIAEIRQYLTDWEIDVIIIQGAFDMVKEYRSAIGESIDCKLFFVHHFEPGWETHYRKIDTYLDNYKNSHGLINKIKSAIHLLAYPYERMMFVRHMPRSYKAAYINADKVVLLSAGFISQYKKFGNINEDSKFCVLPNMLSFEEFLPVERLKDKQTRVLIVTRLEEEQKRISLALRVWKKVKESESSKGWQLDIVGTGVDEFKYRQMVSNENIDNVNFYGRKNPKDYYKKASLFMMTSRSEGWGLTLTESMQNGTVPLAFDSYASLHDIITDGKDGCIIENNNVETYAKRMMQLMADTDLRNTMAKNAINSAKRFTSANVGEMWHYLLNNK